MKNKIMQIFSRIRWFLSDRGEEVFLEYAPCNNGYHTSYSLLRPPRRTFFVAFPETNFLLTTEDWQAETKKRMEREGFSLRLSS